MSQKVIHIVRKFLPSKTSFVRNQIIYHKNYIPTIVYCEQIESNFYKEITLKHLAFQAVQGQVGSFFYNKFRALTKKEENNLIHFLNQEKPDILHIHYGVDALVFSNIIRKVNIPAVVSFYGYDCTSFPKWYYGYGKKLLQKKVFNNPWIKKVFAMSEDMQKDLLSIGCPEEKVIVHYYGTEVAPFTIERKTHKKDRVDFLIISGFDEKKGHMFLMDAFSIAQKSTQKKIYLHIVGDGLLKEQIKNKIDQLGLNSIILHGSVQYGSADHLNLFKMADVFVHPSVTPPNGDKEGIPGAIIEAMAAGLPILSTYHAGIPFIIKNGETGFLIKERDTKALAEAIIKLSNDQSLRNIMGTNAQETAKNKLNITEKEEELEFLYDQLIRNS